jgi:hypothetical protein
MNLTSIQFMMDYVERYIEGRLDRLDFDLDFPYLITKQFVNMDRENHDLTEFFVCALEKQGLYASQGLSNFDHKRLIEKRYREFQSVLPKCQS